MNFAFLSALALAAPPDTIPTRWEVRDTAAFAGRPLLTYNAVELSLRPPRPLRREDDPGLNAKYGLLPVGNHPDAHRLVVWRPNAPDGGEFWLDRNGDGKFDAEERHTLKNPPAELPITIGLKTAGAMRYLSRTVLVRPVADGGLRYAVRGYAVGPLMFAGRSYGALLTDGNGDGCYDTPASDRVWIDLDGNGRFDGLTEQFPLGTPITVAGRPFLVKPAPDGTSVTVRERPTDRGAVRLSLSGSKGARALGVSAQLVSDWGELVTLTETGRPAPLPVGRYALEALSFRMLDDDGRTWNYRFAGERRFDLVVEREKEAVARPIDQVTFRADVKQPAGGPAPGADVSVTPTMRTGAGLELVHCEVLARDDQPAWEPTAEIRLEGEGGKVADRTRSGFL